MISDRYLFADDIGKRESNGEWHFSLGTGYENLLSFLGHVLPGEFKSEFMIFIFYNAKEFSGNTHLNQKELEYAGRRHFKKIANSLNKEIKNLRKDGEYPIVVEALSFDCDSYGWEETHNRRVYSNYGELFAEHKLNAFSNNICQFTQNIYYNTLYSEGLHDESSCPAESHDWALAVFSDIIRFFKETEKANYFYAQNGNDKSNIAGIKNRLLIY